MSTKEIWKDIPNYEGHYQVSNLGRVKSLERQIKNNLGIIYTIRDRILKGALTSRGYINVILQKNCHKKGRSVHSLVAECFLNHKPNGSVSVVNHINFIKTDNKVQNLEIVTTRVNSNKKHLNSSSKHVGVSWYKSYNKWRTQIQVKDKIYHLGYFDCELAAAKAYQDKLKEIITNCKR
tara:strand:+ start:2193 stop:2729 length:537 start_codon:yes stop_codon:yes gene_type:complete